MNKLIEMAYDWSKIPTDLPKENLVLITAKTTHPTFHYTDPKYKIRRFTPEELKEAARSLAKRPVGKNHIMLIENGFTVDSQWNESTQSVEALLFLPTPYVNLIRERQNTDNPVKFSVEYTWRDEKREGDEVEFIGLIFDRVDLLDGLNAGDRFTSGKLVEGYPRRGLVEAEYVPMEKDIKQDQIQQSIDDNSLSFFKELEESEFFKKLGEPLHSDFQKIKDKMVTQYGEKKGTQVYYAWINKMNYDDTKAFPKKKEEASAISIIPDITIKEANLTGRKQIPEQPLNIMTTEQPSKLPVVIDLPQVHTNVTSVGAVADDKGPLAPDVQPTNPNKNLNQEPAKQVNIIGDSPKKIGETLPIQDVETVAYMTGDNHGIQGVDKNGSAKMGDTSLSIPPTSIDSGLDKSIEHPEPSTDKLQDKFNIDKSNQSVEGCNIEKKLEESVKQEPKQEVIKEEPKIDKPIEDVKPIEPSPQEPNKPVEPVVDSKDEEIKQLKTKVAELEPVVTKLQENARVSDSEKAKAVKQAKVEMKKELINEIEKKLPNANIISNFNLGGQIVAQDMRKIVHKLKESIREEGE